MGTVEVALERGPEGFERIVALKRLLPESARNPRHKEMFLREARLAALLAHPNVVHAFAFGELCDELFLAMEYVEGEPLSGVLAATRLEPALVAHVLAEVCDGLHAAHELRDSRGKALHVVHRDVSPHNVMIAFDGRVKVLDFGVAKFEAATTHTRTGEVKGKMAYMSPEQALGDPLDRRSDLFSLGAVLFECLMGRPMWGRGTDLEIMRRLALEAAPRLPETPAIPRELASLHARLVARDPAKRPASARHVADELRAMAGPAAEAALRSLMQRCFAQPCEERRRRMNEALEAIAPDRVPELRSTLDAQMSAPLAPAAVSTPPPRAKRPGRRRFVGVLVVSLALAASVAVATMDPTVTSEAAPRTLASRPQPIEQAPTPVLIAPAPDPAEPAAPTPPPIATPVVSTPESRSATPPLRPKIVPSSSPSAAERPLTGMSAAERPLTGMSAAERPLTGMSAAERPLTGMSAAERPLTGMSAAERPLTGMSAAERPLTGMSAAERQPTGSSVQPPPDVDPTPF
jgi:serine/threonine-protein kinase